jgi:hypothetical protein
MRALTILLCSLLPLEAQILGPILRGGPKPFTLTATTTAPAQTVTIQQLTSSVAQTLYWGDGATSPMPAGSTATLSHEYAEAGSYLIRVPDARRLTTIDLRDAKLGGLNTAQLRSSPLDRFYVTAITSSTIRSADMVAWRPKTWYLYSMPAGGTYSIASADMVAWRPSTWYRSSMPLGAYTIASADMAAWRPTTWYLYSMPAGGTYSIASADMVAWRPTTWYLYSMPAGGAYSIASADMVAWTTTQYLRCYNLPAGAVDVTGSFATLVSLRDLQLQDNGFIQAQVNGVLTGIWGNKANYTYATPALNIGGTNAAPSGTYQSTCPPTTGKEYAYDLVNGICTADGPEWAVVFTP